MKGYFNIALLFGLVLSACSGPEEKKSVLPQLNLSARVQTILQDTSKYNPLVDSLRAQLNMRRDTDQIISLAELSENWRPHSLEFAEEALVQSKKYKWLYGESDAYCKLAINHYRHSVFDSAAYYLDKSLRLAEQKGFKKLTSQAYSWKGELFRVKGDKEKALEMFSKAIDIAKAENDKKRLAFCLNSKAELKRMNGDFREALSFYEESIKYAEEVNDVYRITICNSSMGDIYKIQNDYPKALDYFNHALDLAKRNNDKFRIAFCLSSMGDIYNYQKEYQKALDYFNEAYKISGEIDYKIQISHCESSIGQVYHLLNKNEEALKWFDKALESSEKFGHYDTYAFTLINMGDIYVSKKEHKKALEKYLEALDIVQQLGNKNEIASCLSNIGECHFALKNFSEARRIAQQSLAVSKESEIPDQIKHSAFLLYEINEENNNYPGALEMLKLFMEMKDISGNEEQVKKFAAVEFKAKEEKMLAEQAAKVEVFKAEQARKEEELKRQKTIRYAFTIGFGLLAILSVVIFRSLQQNKKQNKIIIAQKKEVEHQKELVDEKNKEITDSITYAKRLQDAILPPLTMVRQHLPESFILYKPKDIIAGDFYYMEVLEHAETNSETVLIAAADCTGHGVPGAMVSVVCSNALNRAVKEFSIVEPGKILDKVRVLVLETFEKSESEVKDGMDISLAAIEINSSVQSVKVKWAGANNPLWYIRNGEVNEIKANKQPIGKTDDPKPFTTHEIELTKGDSFYLFTDGYADQFGGEKGKKFKYKPLQEKLLALHNESVDTQQNDLLETFNAWKGNLEQIDDVCIIGIKL